MTSSEATVPGDMQVFQALSYGEKWRVARFLAEGEAPPDPRMAAAAIELAESYQGQGPGRATLARWLPAVVIVVCGAGAILLAVGGDALAAILNALIVLINVGALIFNPMTRPRNVARSLEAARRISAAEG
jgi:hypothetical protein